MKNYKAPNALVSKIAFPDDPDGSSGIFSGQKIGHQIYTGESDEEELSEGDDLRGSQTEKFQDILKKQQEDEEEAAEESEATVQPIDPDEFLINDGYKIHMKGIKIHEREIKKAVKNRRKVEKKQE